jgi:hypothetical protein
MPVCVMSRALERIVYASTASPGLKEADLQRILNVSQSNNHERFITGYLVARNGHFMQLIEGPPDEISVLYERIRRDPRHAGVVTLLREAVNTRAFPDWSMNYFRVDEAASPSMRVRGDDPVDSLMTVDAPRELIFLFSKFMRQNAVNSG